ncbi:MAG: DUF6768 family protein [Pseudomonadota bacterium]
MESIDERIRNALSSEDQAFLARMDADGSLYKDVAATFRGRARFLNVLLWFFGFAFFAVAVVCGWQFATQTDLRSMQLWGVGTTLAFIALGMIKLRFWMELQKVAIVREIKRVELQLASLTAALRSEKAV